MSSHRHLEGKLRFSRSAMWCLNVQDDSAISHDSSSPTCPVHLMALSLLNVPEPPHLWIAKEHLWKRKMTSLLISKYRGQSQFRPLFRSWRARQGPSIGLVGPFPRPASYWSSLSLSLHVRGLYPFSTHALTLSSRPLRATTARIREQLMSALMAVVMLN